MSSELTLPSVRTHTPTVSSIDGGYGGTTRFELTDARNRRSDAGTVRDRLVSVADLNSPEVTKISNQNNAEISEGKRLACCFACFEPKHPHVGTIQKEPKMQNMNEMSIEAVYATHDRDWLANQFCFVIVNQSENVRSSVTPNELFEAVMCSRLRAVEADLRKASPYKVVSISELSTNLRDRVPSAWPKTIDLLRYRRNDIFSAADFVEVKDEIGCKVAYSDPPITTFVNYLNQMDHQAKCNPRLYQSEIGRMMNVEALLRVAQLVPFELNTPKFEARIA